MIVNIPENLFMKLSKFKPIITNLKTNDLILAILGMEYNALILTFDKKIREHVKNIFPYIYYCSSKGNMKNEIKSFVEELERRILK